MNANHTQLDPMSVASCVADLLVAEPALSRTALSRRVCAHFNWRSSSGRLKELECRILLNKLAAEGTIALPPSRGSIPRGRKRRYKTKSWKRPDTIYASLAEFGAITLVPVTAADKQRNAVWREEVGRHHYLGAGPLCGQQLRYLVESETYGYVGALAFTSAALYLEARDIWIGWDEQGRRLHLNQVVCNARFLIFPWVITRNLASHVLALCARQLPLDWENAYGTQPLLLETFVDPTRFTGSCYKAAGWELVGRTKGRGRQDRDKAFAAGEKLIFVKPLRDEFRQKLCWTPPTRPKPIYYEQINQQEWEQVEFGSADLGDERLNKRLKTLASCFLANTQALIPEACGDNAGAQAAYRFFRNEHVTMQKILDPHYEATAGRVAACGGTVLAVQDTTSLNYSTHAATDGLGPIGSTDPGPYGLLLHDTMAFTPEGTPLGLVNIQWWARDPEEFGDSEARKNLPVEEKESVKWLISYDAASKLQRRVPEATIISVGDREADFYELFERAAASPDGARLLVRATHNRNLEEEQAGLKDFVRGLPVDGVIELDIPRRGSRSARRVPMNLRYGKTTLQAPKGHKGRGGLQMFFVHVVERDHDGKGQPIEWLLLTDIPVVDPDQAREKLDWYAKRWGIEVYHRVLKSGCKIEDRQLDTTGKLTNCLAIDLIVAWRVFHLTMLGRECPDLPAGSCMDELEWKVLTAKYQGKPAKEPPRLFDVYLMVARLGGYISKPKYYLPGTTVVWRGIVKLVGLVEGWKLAIACGMGP